MSHDLFETIRTGSCEKLEDNGEYESMKWRKPSIVNCDPPARRLRSSGGDFVFLFLLAAVLPRDRPRCQRLQGGGAVSASETIRSGFDKRLVRHEQRGCEARVLSRKRKEKQEREFVVDGILTPDVTRRVSLSFRLRAPYESSGAVFGCRARVKVLTQQSTSEYKHNKVQVLFAKS